MKVIGFTAKVGGGKDTAALLLTQALEEKGYRVTKVSFAKTLKDICTLMFNWDRERLEHDFAYKEGNTLDDGTPDPACEALGMTRRLVMQLIGTEAMRNGLHTDVWVIATKLAIQRGDYDDYDFGLLTDCRFINELQFVRDLDGTLIRLKRMGEQSTLTDQTQHLSELEWEQWTDWDATITNYIDPDLSKVMNMMAFQNKLEDAINYDRIPDKTIPKFNKAVDKELEDKWKGIDETVAEQENERMSDGHWDGGYGDSFR